MGCRLSPAKSSHRLGPSGTQTKATRLTVMALPPTPPKRGARVSGEGKTMSHKLKFLFSHNMEEVQDSSEGKNVQQLERHFFSSCGLRQHDYDRHGDIAVSSYAEVCRN